VDTRFASFVGLYPVCVRHGMTVGELAGFFNGEFAAWDELERGDVPGLEAFDVV